MSLDKFEVLWPFLFKEILVEIADNLGRLMMIISFNKSQSYHLFRPYFLLFSKK
jgi:hypothetical protein